jgi:hypothetical protein
MFVAFPAGNAEVNRGGVVLEIHVQIGQVAYLERRLGSQTLKGSTQVLGGKLPHYLCIEPATGKSAPIFSTVGEPCIIRFLDGSALVAFQAEVVKILADPLPMIVLELTAQLESARVSEKIVVPCRIRAQLSFPESDAEAGFAGPSLEDDFGMNLFGSAPAIQSPQAPLIASIIQIGENGAQIAIPHSDATAPCRAVRDMLDEIPRHQRNDYRVEMLKAFCRGKRLGEIAFRLPAPATDERLDVPCQIRGVHARHDHTCVALRFPLLEGAALRNVETVVTHQNQFFVPLFPSL